MQKLIIMIIFFLTWPIGAYADAIAKICNDSAQTVYVGNTRTLNYHRPTCRYYDCKHCTMSFKSSVDAILAGYHPCDVCRPNDDLKQQHEDEKIINPFSPARYRTLTDA